MAAPATAIAVAPIESLDDRIVRLLPIARRAAYHFWKIGHCCLELEEVRAQASYALVAKVHRYPDRYEYGFFYATIRKSLLDWHRDVMSVISRLHRQEIISGTATPIRHIPILDRFGRSYPSSENLEAALIEADEVKNALRRIRSAVKNDKERTCVELKLMGYTQLAIAMELGVSQFRVSQIYREIGERICIRPTHTKRTKLSGKC